MWLKQIQLFQLDKTSNFSLETLRCQLEALAFTPCLPSMAQSIGWVSPIDEEEQPIAQALNGYIIFCLQVEEKILPASVIRHQLAEKVKRIEATEGKKIRQQEKLQLKDEINFSLLPRAFSRFNRIYAYIDTKKNWLILGTANLKTTEKFISLFKKSVGDVISPIEIKKISSITTNWLKHQNYPTSFSIEKSCVLQDPQQETRIVRCQHQDLFANSIQSLLKDGCEVIQLALCWQDQVKFVLAKDFSLRSIQFDNVVTDPIKELELESKQQKFAADLMIFAETFSNLLQELVSLFSQETIESIVPMAKSA